MILLVSWVILFCDSDDNFGFLDVGISVRVILICECLQFVNWFNLMVVKALGDTHTNCRGYLFWTVQSLYYCL